MPQGALRARAWLCAALTPGTRLGLRLEAKGEGPHTMPCFAPHTAPVRAPGAGVVNFEHPFVESCPCLFLPLLPKPHPQQPLAAAT